MHDIKLQTPILQLHKSKLPRTVQLHDIKLPSVRSIDDKPPSVLLNETVSFITCPWTTSAKINISYSILFNLTTSYSSYFGDKKGISRNKTSFVLLMSLAGASLWCHPFLQ